MKSKSILTLLFAALSAAETFAAPMGAAFTYQGRLNDGGAPANGVYDISFALYDSETNGTLIGNWVYDTATPVTNGLFTLQLNVNNEFGPTPFNGSARWLQIYTRTNQPMNLGNPYIALSPRQPLTPAPHAMFAANAGQAALANSANFATNAAQATTALSANSANSVAWGNITGIPAGFADGVDNDTTYSAGVGLTLSGASNQFSVNFAGSGNENTAARSDHGHFGANWSGNSSGYGLVVVNNSTTGNGLYSQQGTGSGYFPVWGYKAALWGETSQGDAVYGASGSPSGSGVLGYATATSGANFGVYGRSDSPNGIGVFARGSGTTGTALKISNGALRVAGAGTNSPTPVFLHVVTPANLVSNAWETYTIIENPYCNDDPNALVFVTQNAGRLLAPNYPPTVYPEYDETGIYATNRWVLFANDPGSQIRLGHKFNVLVVKQ